MHWFLRRFNYWAFLRIPCGALKAPAFVTCVVSTAPGAILLPFSVGMGHICTFPPQPPVSLTLIWWLCLKEKGEFYSPSKARSTDLPITAPRLLVHGCQIVALLVRRVPACARGRLHPSVILRLPIFSLPHSSGSFPSARGPCLVSPTLKHPRHPHPTLSARLSLWALS